MAQTVTLTFSERELEVILNALNYASGEWANLGDQELSALSDDADALEARLKAAAAQE